MVISSGSMFRFLVPMNQPAGRQGTRNDKYFLILLN
jgi:hypothetical protein